MVGSWSWKKLYYLKPDLLSVQLIVLMHNILAHWKRENERLLIMKSIRLPLEYTLKNPSKFSNTAGKAYE